MTIPTLRSLLDSAPSSRQALVVPDQRRLSYGALRDHVDQVAGALAGLGVRDGDRVAIAIPNGAAAVVATIGAATAAIAAPLNPAYTEDEFRFYLEDTAAKVLLLPPDGNGAALRAAAGRARILTIDGDRNGALRIGERVTSKTPAPRSPSDVALVLHTSGSTGRPKRVPLTHGRLAMSAQNVAGTYALGPEDVSLCVMPLFHVHGFVASTLATLATGGTIVIPTRVTPLSFARLLSESKATWYSAVPTLHQLVLARHRPRREDDRHLRFVRSCSAPLAPLLMHDLEAAFGVPVLEAYGMTEAAHQVASNPLPPGSRHAGSVGRGTGIRIGVISESGQHLPPGQPGEVVLEGPTVIDGYENDPAANAMSFLDGWFRTGDLGRLDAEGYLTLIGRCKELINRGGEKISPREIEEVLLSHPLVAEAVCFGIPHRIWGEEVAAVVVARRPIQTRRLISFCGERLAAYKLPKAIRLVRQIPRTATGKIQRRTVAAAYSFQ